MERILVIGCPGSGKTTLSGKLAEKTGLPLIHLDQLYWTDGWTEVPQEVFDGRLLSALNQPQWVIDGNFGRTLPLRLSYCDTVIYLDFPRGVCLWGALTRWLKHHGQSRPDMGGNCPERLSPEFLRSIWSFRRQHRTSYDTLLKQFPAVTVHTFHRRKDAWQWLETI